MPDHKPLAVTSSAGGVVVGPERKILLVKQRGDTWSLPKGHVELGEQLVDAARREIYEESGVHDLVYITFLGEYQRMKELSVRFGGPELKMISIFLFETSQHILNPIDYENPQAAWVPKELVADLLSYKEDRDFFLSIINRFD